MKIMVRRKQPVVPSGTPSNHGNFDTAARADTGAARIRNMTSPMGSISRNWDHDRANTPSDYPEIFDRPE
jgi:hypothetical protein